jgi:hypothetical protein
VRSPNLGARQLPTHHITIRVPWHDSEWAGSVCFNPVGNTSCLTAGASGSGVRKCHGKRLRAFERRELDLLDMSIGIRNLQPHDGWSLSARAIPGIKRPCAQNRYRKIPIIFPVPISGKSGKAFGLANILNLLVSPEGLEPSTP